VIEGKLNRRLRFDGGAAALNSANPDAYELFNPQPKDAQYYFVLEYAAARSGGSDITLGRGNLLEGSEAVVVNGERWIRDRDYTIDYDLGRVTLKRQLGPSDQLSVDYSYAPLFAQASKTLIGSAFRLEGRDRSLGGAFLYESKGAQDLRPRLGEEPSRTLITDLNGEWRFKPAFLTRLADALPGVRTTTPSEFNIQAEGGLSFPNPNTRNEVFVDDMEGVRDAVSLQLTPDSLALVECAAPGHVGGAGGALDPVVPDPAAPAQRRGPLVSAGESGQQISTTASSCTSVNCARVCPRRRAPTTSARRSASRCRARRPRSPMAIRCGSGSSTASTRSVSTCRARSSSNCGSTTGTTITTRRSARRGSAAMARPVRV
jgi:hypothetical protein